MKRKILIVFISIFIALFAMSACGRKEDEAAETGEKSNLIKVGFSQVGAESAWRTSNSDSMLETFTEENGFELIFENGQQKQSNQIMAIRSFIQQGVDYIVLAPVAETGWDTVLQEAKDAGIPVIIVDRMVDVEDDSLFTCWVGSDFELEAQKVTAWINEYTRAKGLKPETINIVDIQGSEGASAQLGRTKGLEQAAREYGWNLLEKKRGDFTLAKGREVMELFLKKYDNINVVYAENDDMAIGAIEAIEAAGKRVGTNIRGGQILLVSFDGTSEEALALAKAGKIACIGECNPLHGPRVKAIIDTLERGEIPNKIEYVQESVFSSYEDVLSIDIDDKVYPITIRR